MDFETMRAGLTGETLLEIVTNVQMTFVTVSMDITREKNYFIQLFQIRVPKFEIESDLNGNDVLHKLGVSSMFRDSADFSKVCSPFHLYF